MSDYYYVPVDDEYQKTGLVIACLTRLRNSSMGNPRLEITFDDGSVYQTQSNSYVGYTIQNSEYIGVPLRVTFNAKHKIMVVEHMSTEQ